MRKLIVANITTLDGFYAGPDSNPMVLNMDHSFDTYNLQRMRAAGTVLLGRRSFELFSSYWPAVADAAPDPANQAMSETNREFSRRYLDIPKIVISDSLEVPAENPWYGSTEVIRRTDAHDKLRAEKGRDGAGDIVIFGSHVLWNWLLAQGLLDEIHLLFGPSAISTGVPLFENPCSLSLIDASSMEGSDNVLHRYAVRAERETGEPRVAVRA